MAGDLGCCRQGAERASWKTEVENEASKLWAMCSPTPVYGDHVLTNALYGDHVLTHIPYEDHVLTRYRCVGDLVH